MAFNDNLEFSSCAVGVDLTVSQCYKCLSVTGVSVLQVSQCPYVCIGTDGEFYQNQQAVLWCRCHLILQKRFCPFA